MFASSLLFRLSGPWSDLEVDDGTHLLPAKLTRSATKGRTSD